MAQSINMQLPAQGPRMRPPAEWAMIAEAYEMSVAEIVRSIRTEVVVQSDYWLGQALDVQNAVRAHTAISQMIEKGNEDG